MDTALQAAPFAAALTPGTPDPFLGLRPLLPASEYLPELALALGIGLLIGVQRGWVTRAEPPGSRVAGVRTYALLGLFGGWVGLALTLALHVVALLFAGAAAVAVLAGYVRDMRLTGHVSVTSTLAAIVTLALGATATAGYPGLASICAGATVLLLASRDALHGALERVSESDLKALIRLALVIFLILPVLPDQGYGPYGLNPRRLWMVVVTCGSISFIGYVLSRWLGGRQGALVTAMAGALVSSTAVTLEGARRIREQGSSPAQDVAVVGAQVVMLGRSLLLVLLLAPSASAAFAGIVMPSLVIVAVLAAGLFARSLRSSASVEPVPTKPPGLKLAFVFAAAIAVVSTLAGWAEDRFGEGSAAIMIALGGMVDIDSAIAALSILPEGTLSPAIAAYAVAAPVLFNTLGKLVLLVSIAGARRSGWPALGLAASAAALVAAALSGGFLQQL